MMTDDRIEAALKNVRSFVAAAIDRVNSLEAENASLTEQVERLTRERDYLRAGVNAVVNCQSALTRAQVREAMDDLLVGGGWEAWGTEDQSPFVERAAAAEAREKRLREAPPRRAALESKD